MVPGAASSAVASQVVILFLLSLTTLILALMNLMLSFSITKQFLVTLTAAIRVVPV